jgi:ABC-2 type transport system ATP-binding protein
MLPDGTIRAHRLWKRFRADHTRMLLRDHLDAMRARRRGNPDAGWRWVLRDVDLDVAPGDSVGLIGVNGSGKSTLLKILTRVMYPYAGTVEVAGRVGSLIEVRSGIHPDLTGTENIYLFGSLLGLPRRAIARRFDEIVAFADLEHAVHRQLKFYSLGMQTRLGFGVMAYLEPAVLLVDEVLAVGDATFQQRCLDRMRTVLAEGTTLVYVSHDLATVEATCTRTLWLHDGEVRADGPTRDVIERYHEAIEEDAESLTGLAPGGPVDGLWAEVAGSGGDRPRTSEPLDIRVLVRTARRCSGRLYVGVSEGPASPVFVISRDVTFPADGELDVRCHLPRLPLPRGRYHLWVGVFDGDDEIAPWRPAARFDVDGPDLDPAPRAVACLAPIHVDGHWDIARAGGAAEGPHWGPRARRRCCRS